ncbi:sensor histidine kinase [Novosphingobium malaysiense]|uniref:histidine kinase n=1 Tax=Novosphingobium malaysiense TaxID=1348853 RepID=A0A0B1ZVL0_9SPHN|nr:histidine kinase dimerization/phosphoacceptor domain -containing protein [Novosphingobium malaysiense]KHK93213.1 histidine kinase [Novosphingobium malaysiense]
MKRLANYDVVRRFRPGPARLGVQLLFGLVLACLMIALRSAVDVIAPTSGPFALVYPTVLLATLYGRWPAGVLAYCVSFVWAWYIVLPSEHSFNFEVPTDPLRVVINAFAVLVVLVFAEIFRWAVQSAIFERDREIERRILLLEELEHRTKNNFALVASLLEYQKQREVHQSVDEALDQTLTRIHSFARAYANLAETQGEGAAVAMQPYLEDIVAKVTAGMFDENIEVARRITPHVLPRQVAVAIGLFTNEALTNCAKYAFPEGREGKVVISFDANDEGWTLEIFDNGAGDLAANAPSTSGIGTRLLNAFASQAQARYEMQKGPHGCTVRLSNR